MTPVPLAFEEVTLLDWQDNNSRGTWSGTAQIVASRARRDPLLREGRPPDNEIAGGVLAFEGRHCEAVVLDLVVLSGAEECVGPARSPTPHRRCP